MTSGDKLIFMASVAVKTNSTSHFRHSFIRIYVYTHSHTVAGQCNELIINLSLLPFW